MTEASQIISVAGLTAALLAPVGLAYSIITLIYGDRMSRAVRVMGFLAVLQGAAVLIYMATIWREMSRTGLGL